MDHIRKELDQLMGKDRNLPLSALNKKKEHFSDPDVCKDFLIAFCPNDLFPNTKADMGPCSKRHDEYFKKLFEKDPNKELYIHRYEEGLMDRLKDIISDLDSKIRRTLAKTEVPVGEGERPKEVSEKIEGLNKKINFFLDQAERLGEEGQIDESESLMKEIDRLKMQRTELMSMSESSLMQSEKQMHVCEVCGAMQSLLDTEKRITLHLEGKLHTGYALIRKTLVEIKQRREEYRRKKEQEALAKPPEPAPLAGKAEDSKKVDSEQEHRSHRRDKDDYNKGNNRYNDRRDYQNRRGGPRRSRSRSRSRDRSNKPKGEEKRDYKGGYTDGKRKDQGGYRDHSDHRDNRGKRDYEGKHKSHDH